MAATSQPREKAILETLANSRLRVGHVFLNVRQQRLHYLNQMARQLHLEGVPFTVADLSQHPLLSFTGETVKPEDFPLLAAWRSEQAQEGHYYLVREQGVAWQVSWTATAIHDAKGTLTGVLGTVTCGPQEPDAQRMAELAHDLRTPLQSLRLLCDMTKRLPADDPTLAKTVASIQSAADRAIQIALDLLECCRGPAGKSGHGSNRELAWFRLESFLTRLIDEQAIAAREKGLVWETDLAAADGWEALSDPVRLGRVLSNLLANAVRYTPRGRVQFIASWKDEGDGRALTLSVMDTGPGISQEEHESIFHPFERGRAGRDSDSGGSGLGLAVVDRLIEELGLTLDVYSEYGKGSAFHLQLPPSMLRQIRAD